MVVALGAPPPRTIDAAKTKQKGTASRVIADGSSAEERELAAAEAKSIRILSQFGLDHPGAFLQVKLDDGWKNITDQESKQIKDQLKGGLKKFPIQARGTMYLVDFTDPKHITQKNASTKKARQLRIVGARDGGA